jgi:hypothetical protein
VANGTRGTITALDPDARTLTIRLEGKDRRELTLPGWYLDGRGRSERNRRVDLAYATTGHRAQGLTRWRALVRLTGREDSNWLYVQLSRARHQTTLYPVVGPESQGPAELDLPDREAGDGYDQLAQALARVADQRLAIDTPSSLDLRRLSTGELRAERDRLRALLDQVPRDRAWELTRASARRADADQALTYAMRQGDPPPRPATGMLRRWGRGNQQSAGMRGAAVQVATQQANWAAERERDLRQHQQARAGWLEANVHLGPAYRRVVRELAWQRRARGLAAEHDQPGWLREELGPEPDSTQGRRAWRQAAAAIADYRTSYHISDSDQALGSPPRDPAQRAAYWEVQQAIGRVHTKQQRQVDRPRDQQPTHPLQSSVHPSQPDAATRPGRQRPDRNGPERAVG